MGYINVYHTVYFNVTSQHVFVDLITVESHYNEIAYSECLSIVKYFDSPSKSCIIICTLNIVNILNLNWSPLNFPIMRFNCIFLYRHFVGQIDRTRIL